jgi:cardiolipin synthase
MLEAIQRAARRISFETYVYRSGEAANRFTTAFEAAARRGVRVNIVVDAIGGSGMKDDHVRRLREAGCRVAMFNFPSWYSMEHVNYRTHRKILVVDGEIAFTGGAGVADHWLGNADSPDHWRDTQVRMEGPIVRLVEAAFYENFVETDQEVTAELDDPPVAVDGRAASLAVRSSFTGGSNDLKRLYLLALASARRAIDITTPYFVLDDSIEWSLQEAIARGVKVRVLVEGDITDAMPVKYASRQAYDRLLRMGVEIYEYRPTMLHAKAVVIDGVWSMFGSANFDNRSLELNDELNIAVASPELALAFLRDFEQDLRRSSRLELSSWRQRSLLDKTRERFWSAFAEVF